MKLVKLIEFLRARMPAVKIACYVLLGLTALAGVLVNKEPAHTAVEKLPLPFWSVFGFIACAVIVLASKWFGHAGIMTREDYYEDSSKGPKG